MAKLASVKVRLNRAFKELKGLGAPVSWRDGDDKEHFNVSLEGLTREEAKANPDYDDLVTWGSYYDGMYLNPLLDYVAEKQCLYIEWEDPGGLLVCNARW